VVSDAAGPSVPVGSVFGRAAVDLINLFGPKNACKND
jgi:hypothetical protein